MSNTILIKKSGTANAVPGTGDLAYGELAINYADGNLFYKNSAGGGTITVIASNKFVNVSGNITGGNVLTNGLVSATGNVYGGNLIASDAFIGNISLSGNVNLNNVNASGNVSASGNVTGNYILGNGAFLTGVITSVSNISNGSSNVNVVSSGGNVTVGVAGVSNIAVFTTAGVSLTGNVAAGNVLTDNLLYANGQPWDLQQPAGSNGWIQYNDNGSFGASGNLAFNSSTNIFSTANISANGNVNSTNLLANGIVSAYGNIVGNLWRDHDGNSLISFDQTGAGNIYFTTFDVWARLGQSNANSSVYGFFVDNGFVSANTIYGSESVQSGNTISAAGNIFGANLRTSGSVRATEYIYTAGNLDAGNVLTGGYVSATGNVTAAYFIGNGSQLTGVVASSVDANNLTGTTLSSNVIYSSLTSVGTLSNLSVSGSVTGGNLYTGGVVSATGNITGGNISTSGSGGNISGANVISGTTLSATANVIGGNITTDGQISATGNITGGNVNTDKVAGTSLTVSSTGDLNLQPTGNVVLANAFINGVAYPSQDQDAASKIYVDNMVTTGLAFHPAVFVATTDTLANITGGTITYAQPNGVANGVGATLTTTGSFNLIDSGNVQTLGTRILVKDQANAVQNGVYVWSNATVITRSTDADEYGPNSSEQLSINDYFFVQSGNINLGSAYVVDAPPGTITFGTSNITFAQFSQSQVYSANTNAGLSLIGQTFNAKVDNNTTAFDGGGNIVVKASANLTTPNIGAATGTSLSVSGNITGGNLDTAGTVTGGNIETGGTVSATGNITGGNVTTGGLVSASGNVIGGNISTAGNVTASYFIGNGSQLTGVIASSAGFPIVAGTSNINGVTNGNISITVAGTPNVAVFASTGEYVNGVVSASGNVTGANFDTTGILSASGNVTGGNIVTGGIITATGTVTGGNLITSGFGNIATLTVSTFANVTATTVSTSNITGALRVAGGVGVTGNVYADNMYSGGDSVLTTTSTIDGGTY